MRGVLLITCALVLLGCAHAFLSPTSTPSPASSVAPVSQTPSPPTSPSVPATSQTPSPAISVPASVPPSVPADSSHVLRPSMTMSVPASVSLSSSRTISTSPSCSLSASPTTSASLSTSTRPSDTSSGSPTPSPSPRPSNSSSPSPSSSLSPSASSSSSSSFSVFVATPSASISLTSSTSSSSSPSPSTPSSTAPSNSPVSSPIDGNTNPPAEDEESYYLWIIIVSVIFAVIVACCCCVFLSFIILICCCRRKTIRHYEDFDFFTTRPELSLSDVLNDPDINELKWSEITVGKRIGRGASGIVWEGTWDPPKGPRTPVALKELHLDDSELMSEELIKEFLAEVKYMSVLKHPNVVTFYGIARSPDDIVYLVTELMQRGNLRETLNREKPDSARRLQFAIDAAQGLAFIHSKRLIHRDIKTQNLLVNNKWETKIADFGISTVRPTVTRTMTCTGTPIYMAPEVLEKNKSSEKADVYSFGIVLMELFTTKVPYNDAPYDTMSSALLTYRILEGARPSIDGVHPQMQELVCQCWDQDPYNRPDFPAIVSQLQDFQRSGALPTTTLDSPKMSN